MGKKKVKREVGWNTIRKSMMKHGADSVARNAVDLLISNIENEITCETYKAKEHAKENNRKKITQKDIMFGLNECHKLPLSFD